MPFFGYTTAQCTTAQQGVAASSATLLWQNAYNQATATTTTQAYLSQQGLWTSASASTYHFLGDELVEQEQYLGLARQRVAVYRERTEEERVALAQMNARIDRQRAERQEALHKSRDLLLAHLTPEQRDTFENRKWFVVHGGRTRTKYRIRTESYTHNIDVLRGGGDRVSHQLCAHCAGTNIPLHDHHLTQKLSLECDEDYFLSIANRS